MSIIHTFQDYQEELALIQAQNRIECDLYSIIAQMIRESTQTKRISLRDVSARRKSAFAKCFTGNSGFPDFVIRTRTMDNSADILGAIEIKYSKENLDNPKYLKQLNGHIEFYKQVLYTNGLEWRFYHKEQLDKNWVVTIGTYRNKRFIWNEEKQWQELLSKLKEIDWYDSRISKYNK